MTDPPGFIGLIGMLERGDLENALPFAVEMEKFYRKVVNDEYELWTPG